MNNVVLVDRNNIELGIADKLQAHKDGLLHRAFSILIYNDNREILLQKRSSVKYHTPNLWTNTCCSHPFPKESYRDAISRRLKDEMGLNCFMDKTFSFTYKSKLCSNMIEHEHDTVFIGKSNQKPKINLNEVSDFKYINISDLKIDIKKNPFKYTPWFKMILDKIDSSFFLRKSFYRYA